MSHIGTFGSFTQARLAIYAAQLGLSVTGNNISNVNTQGYTRQRLDQVPLKVGGSDRYQAPTDIRVGNGVLPTGVSQIRDPYLDIRYRNENASVGAMSTKLNGLDNIQAIIDEVGKGGEVKEGEQFGILHYQLGKLFQALSGLTDQTGQQEYDVQVRSSADTLCQEFRSYASQLEELYNDTVETYQKDIVKVNNLLTNIRDLNDTIRKCDINGDKALELRDQRNNLIDKLSNYVKIDVRYTKEDIGIGKTVERLQIYLGNANPDKSIHTDESLIVDGQFCTQLQSAIPVLNKDLIYEKEGGGYTADPKEAKLTPQLNPDFDRNQPAGDDNPQYIKKDGGTTNNPDEAQMIPVERTDASAFQYMAKGSTADHPQYTNDPALAETVLKANPNFKEDDEHSLPYLDEDGIPTNNTAEKLLLNEDPATNKDQPYLDQDGKPTAYKPAYRAPVENPDYKPYVDSKGEPTDLLEKAVMEDLPNFGLRLSELKDANDRVLQSVTKLEERITDATEYSKEGVSVLLPDGRTRITTYRTTQQRMLIINENVEEPPEGVTPDPTNPDHKQYFKYQKTAADGTVTGTNNYKEADREVVTTYYAQDYIKTPSKEVDLDDNDLLGSLQSTRELLTESGEFTTLDTLANVDESAAGKHGIPYFQKTLDLLANQLATSFNEINRGYLTDPSGVYITSVTGEDGSTIGIPLTFETATQAKDEDGNPLFEEKADGTQGDPIMETFSLTKDTKWEEIPTEVMDQMMEKVVQTDPPISSVEEYLNAGRKDADGNPVLDENKKPVTLGFFQGGNLISVNGNTDADSVTDEDGNVTIINASNISVSATWAKGPLIVNSFICPPDSMEPASTDSSNILAMKGLQYEKMAYLPQTFVPYAQKEPMFTGTFEEMMTNVSTILGHDQQTTSTMLDNFYQETTELDSSRANISSVDFNDEAMNLMQYSKSYNAACRLMTTLDSVLDKLINGTGLTT